MPPVPLPLKLPFPLRRNFDGDEVPMPKCDLLNVILQDNTEISDYLRFQTLKNRQICGLNCTTKNDKCFSFKDALPPPDLLPGALPLDPTTCF